MSTEERKPLTVWYIETTMWDANWLKGELTSLLVEAPTCTEAVALAGEGDGRCEIRRVVNMGKIVMRSREKNEEEKP